MINFKSSILYSITFIFFLSIVSVILAFLFLIRYDKEKYTEELNTKYSIIAGATLFHLNNFITADEMKEQIKGYKMEEITNLSVKNVVIDNGTILQTLKNKIGESAIINYQSDNYLSVTHGGNTLLLKDLEFQSYRYMLINLIFALVLLIISGAYILTIRKIRPLKSLKNQIDKFAGGDFEVPARQSGTDEISEVANAFYDSVNHIKKMTHSRQLFLRNIMHELKTPITKGRISAEMIENPKQKNRLVTVFERMETMINELASIERLTSGVGLTNVGTYRLIDIFDEAIDLAMIERANIELDIAADISLNVDFKLFSLAIKNLIDNGIKYSPDKKVRVKADENAIRFISVGKALDRSLEYYLAPFTQGNSGTKGFGLGLYIVDNIIKAHKINFTYRYSEDGENIFSFENLSLLQEKSPSSAKSAG